MNRLGMTLIGAGIALASSAGVMAVGGLGVVSLVPDATTQAAQAEPPASRRCPHCGRIESTRDVSDGTDNRAIRLREYTVRMADGSMRAFIGSPADRWRLGESLILIDGAAQPAR